MVIQKWIEKTTISFLLVDIWSQNLGWSLGDWGRFRTGSLLLHIEKRWFGHLIMTHPGGVFQAPTTASVSQWKSWRRDGWIFSLFYGWISDFSLKKRLTSIIHIWIFFPICSCGDLSASMTFSICEAFKIANVVSNQSVLTSACRGRISFSDQLYWCFKKELQLQHTAQKRFYPPSNNTNFSSTLSALWFCVWEKVKSLFFF